MRHLKPNQVEWDLQRKQKLSEDLKHIRLMNDLKRAVMGAFLLALMAYAFIPEKVTQIEPQMPPEIIQGENRSVGVATTTVIRESSPYTAAMLILKYSEGLRLKEYSCPAGVCTIGWGNTKTGKKNITLAEANEMAANTYKKCYREITKRYPNHSHIQRSAVAVFFHNNGQIGPGLHKLLTEHKDPTPMMMKYVNIKTKDEYGNTTTKKLDGLVKRRKLECRLYHADTQELGQIIKELQQKVKEKIIKST